MSMPRCKKKKKKPMAPAWPITLMWKKIVQGRLAKKRKEEILARRKRSGAFAAHRT